MLSVAKSLWIISCFKMEHIEWNRHKLVFPLSCIVSSAVSKRDHVEEVNRLRNYVNNPKDAANVDLEMVIPAVHGAFEVMESCLNTMEKHSINSMMEASKKDSIASFINYMRNI